MKKISLILSCLLLSSCASKIFKYDKADQLSKNEEFEKQVQIVVVEPPPAPPTPLAPAVTEAVSPTPTTTTVPTKGKNKKAKLNDKKSKAEARRQPDLESDVGFQGRRPLVDPFRVGEKILHEVSYFGVEAGSLELEVKPFVEVNGRKSYNFQTAIKTTSLFASFYAVDDYVETQVDFESLIPSAFSLHVKESAQLREARSYFDHDKKVAKFWEKKVTEKSGEEFKKLEWDLAPYSQNVFSAVFYMRMFHWDVGVENAYRVADNGENFVFRGKAIRREEIKTDAGKFKAIVIKPEVILKNTFNPTGDTYIWISDDDRKYILRIESKIKIGTLVSEITELNPGQP